MEPGNLPRRTVPPAAQENRLVFVVEDDAELREMLQQYLGTRGFDVIGMGTADEALHRLKRLRPDLAIVDVMMPGTNGLQMVRKLRTDGDDLPLIVLTARCDEIDRIIGLEMGADDYLGKPFNPRELLARMQAILRRRTPSRAALPADDEATIIGPWLLDPRTRILSGGESEVRLTSAEFALLRVLATNPMKPLSRMRLLEMTGDPRDAHGERSIDVRILRLRALLETDPKKPCILQTVRGIGYVFVPPP
jgi:two-component system phosphate regulon response regulator OmpR